MEILTNIFVFSIGWFLLIFAANWLIQGCVKFSYILKLTPLFIGLVLIGFGTSTPELGVGITATAKNQGIIALGNILGSNIANIGLIVGLCAIFNPLGIKDKSIFKREIFIMLLSVVLLYVLSLDLLISRLDGLILISLFIVFCFVSYKAARKSFDYEEAKDFKLKRWLQNVSSRFVVLLIISLSIIGVFLGAHLMVEGGVNLARIFGINPWIIAIIVFAIGTSLPELSVSVVASFKKAPSISIGTIVGSNIFNILFVLGIVSVIRPITLQPSILKFELPVVFVFSFILLTVMKTEYKISRLEGLVIFLGYIGFIILLLFK